MGVPLLDLKAHHEPLHHEIMAAVEQTFRSQAFILGPEVGKLEESVATYCQAQYGIGVTSGTDALLIALMALGIGQGDEVITTPYSFFATAGAVVRLGAKPVLVDIDPRTFNIDPSRIETAITKKNQSHHPRSSLWTISRYGTDYGHREPPEVGCNRRRSAGDWD